ncbi:MAG: hypothetical protein KDD61_12465 [Bdellovibrionales bacterium]|nr:hypothetical protein [Bdellovibrionales bacterium]
MLFNRWFRIVVVVISLVFLHHNIFAAALNTKSQQYAALEAVLAELEVHYGMERFKEREFAITINGLRKKYRRLIRTATTLEEDAGFEAKKERKILSPRQMQLLLVGLAAELRDGHTNISTKSVNIATLGIHSAAIDGKLYVTGFSENLYSGQAVVTEVKVGDEIVSINGVPVQELAKRNLLYVQDGTYAAREQAALEMTITIPYALLPEVKEGDVATLVFRRAQQGEFEGKFNWIEAADFIQLRSMFPNEFPNPSEGAEFDNGHFVFGRSGYVRSYFREGLKNLPPGSISDVGLQFNAELEAAAKEPKRRKGEMILQPTQRIPAYIIHYKGKNIGVIRIPSYSPNEIMNEYMWVLNVLNRMNYSTDMLVIDQLGNSGGSVFLVMKWLGLFASGRPLTTVSTDTKISETLLEMHQQGLLASQGRDRRGPHRYSDLRMNARELAFMREHYDSGNVWTGLRGDMGSYISHEEGEAGQMYPDEFATYDKPILLINDSRSASGGDFFPAMMQHNHRAVIMGETSKGLGGPVYRSVDSMPGSEVSMRCTSGYCERPNGLPVENRGAVPDIFRGVTPYDLLDEFRSYSYSVLEAGLALLKGTALEEIQNMVKTNGFSQMQSFGVSYRAPKEVIEGFQGLSLSVATIEEGPVEARVPALMEIYKVSTEGILAHVPESGISAETWELFIYPLPSELVNSDLFLPGLWRKGEVLERLNDMLKLKRYEKWHPLINVILEQSQRLPGNIRFADPCERLLLNL